jgi:hypothetical protein
MSASANMHHCRRSAALEPTQCPLWGATALLAPNGKSVAQAVLSVPNRPVVYFCSRRWHDLRKGFSTRIGLRRKHWPRCHVGQWGRRGGENLYAVRMPLLGQTDAAAGDYRRRTRLKRCIRDEQQSDQCQSYYCKKAEGWHSPLRQPVTLGTRSRTVTHMDAHWLG